MGYRKLGTNLTVSCNGSSWSLAVCAPNDCTPTYVANSNYAHPSALTGTTGTTANVICDGGYTGGGTVITCGADGNFTGNPCVTSDNTSPTLISSTPLDNATGVDTGSNIVLEFSENVKAGSGNITVKYGSDTFESFDVSTSVSITNQYVTISPTSNFSHGVNYHVVIPSGAILDFADNSYAGISDSTTLDFTTGYNNCSYSSGITMRFRHIIVVLLLKKGITPITCENNYALVGNQITCNNCR